MELKLTKPLQFGKVEVTKLDFRDNTTAADYLSFDKKGGVAQNIALIASMTGTDEALILQLSGKDYQAAVKIIDAVLKEDETSEEDTEKK